MCVRLHRLRIAHVRVDRMLVILIIIETTTTSASAAVCVVAEPDTVGMLPCCIAAVTIGCHMGASAVTVLGAASPLGLSLPFPLIIFIISGRFVVACNDVRSAVILAGVDIVQIGLEQWR